MSERVKPKYFIPHQRIVKQGDEGDDMFILKEGKVSVLIRNEQTQEDTEVATLGPGTYFGDLALLGVSTRRSATILSLTNVTVFMLSKEDFDGILTKLPDQGHWLRKRLMGVVERYKR